MRHANKSPKIPYSALGGKWKSDPESDQRQKLTSSYQLTVISNLFSARKLRHKTQSEARPDKVLVVHVAAEVVCLEI